jgi:hypothetical protein
MLLQPSCELTSLLHFQVYAVVHALHRLLQCALRYRFVMNSKKVPQLVAHAQITERAGRAHDEDTRQLFAPASDLFPMRADEIPGELLAGGIL